MRKRTLFGYIESEVIINPILEHWQGLINELDLNENKLKIYFLLNKYIYRDVRGEAGEIEDIFDSGFYTKEFDLTFESDLVIKNDDDLITDPDSETKDYFFVLQEKIDKLVSLHSLIFGKFLPFTVVAVTKTSSDVIPTMRKWTQKQYDDFVLHGSKNEWDYLQNDFDILYTKISKKKYLQKVLIWYTFAKLAHINVDKFMHYYKCLEQFARVYHQHKTDELRHFINEQFPTFKPKVRDKMTYVPNSALVHSYLRSYGIDDEIADRIESFRNQKIAHGHEYDIEYKSSLEQIIEVMDDIIYDIICWNIKKMNIINLKSPSFLRDYAVLINRKKNKIAFIYSDSDPIYKLHEWNIRIFLKPGYFDDDHLIEEVSGRLELHSINVSDNLVRKLIENPGLIFEHYF